MYSGIEGSTSALSIAICRRRFIMSIQNSLFSNQKPTLLQDIMTSKDWIAKALNSSNYAADFSIGSLKEIDRFFDEQNTPDGILNRNRGQILFALGAYIGEVIISAYGGEWLTDDSDPQGEINIAVKLKDDSIIFPVQRAMKRYANGKEDSIYDYGIVLSEHTTKA